MGLDAVEIVMAWEEAFDVKITDDEAAALRTPRHAVNLLAAKLNATADHRGPCLTLRAFNRLRRGLVSGAKIPRSQVVPHVPLHDLLPPRQRQARWRAAQVASGLPALPRLGWGFGLIRTPVTVADAARMIVSASPKSLKNADELWTQDEIRTIVRAIVSEYSEIKDFSDDDDFIYDIGID